MGMSGNMGGQDSNQPGGGAQGGGGGGGGFNIPWSGTGNVMNDATAQMGVQFGKQMAQVGGDYVNRNVSRFFEWRREESWKGSLRNKD